MQLHQAVEGMFAIIQQLNRRSLEYGKTIEQVNQSSHEMRQTAVVLQSSAQKVRVDAGKLQKLVGQFETSEEGKRRLPLECRSWPGLLSAPQFGSELASLQVHLCRPAPERAVADDHRS